MRWAKGNQIPALVTTSPVGTPRNQAGVLSAPNTSVLFGNEEITDELRSGVRGTVTRWWNSDPTRAIEFSFEYIGDDSHSGDFSASSLGTPILARPFRNAVTSLEDSELVAFPARVSGRVDVLSSSQGYSGELLLREQISADEDGWFDFVYGYRFFRFDESLAIREDLTTTDPGGLVPLNTRFQIADDFAVANDFHGGELGLNTEYYRGMFSLELLGKVAIGTIRRKTSIDGRTVTTLPGQAATVQNGGLMALPTNMGTRADHAFGVLPEIGITGKVQVTQRFSVVAGYSLIMLNDVVRTGEQIDRSLNTSQLGGRPLVGVARPLPIQAQTDFWIQGINLGMDFIW